MKRYRGNSRWTNLHDNFTSNNVYCQRAGVEEEQHFTLNLTNCGLEYEITMQTSSDDSGVMTGSWKTSGISGYHHRTGTCVFRLFEADNGELAFVGNWNESGARYDWFTHVRPEGG